MAVRTLQISFWTRLMSAAHSRAQRNEFNVHLDSAGNRFGAMARGAGSAVFWAPGNRGDCFAQMKMRALN